MSIDLSLRGTKKGALALLYHHGYRPAFVIDVGAHTGTYELYQSFYGSIHVLIEPIQEYEEILKQICSRLPHATYLIAAASDKSGSSTLQVKTDGKISHLADAAPAQSAVGQWIERACPTIALDDLITSPGLSGKGLLKIDVDGHELSVLRGAEKLLAQIDYLIVEATLFNQIHQVIEHLTPRGFVIYDILEPLYRPLDHALWQVDLAFVPKNSKLRENKGFE